MTAPRIARAGKSRFFICLFLLILIFGFVAIFHTSQTELDELRQVGLRCEQQQESLAAQMQVVVESKFRLEKSLSAERVMNEQIKQELQIKAKEDKELKDKTAMESNLRFASLQQHYKLLKSENEDLKENCAKTKVNQSNEINGLEGKVKSLQAQLTQIERERVKDTEHWKVKYKQIETEKLNLLKLVTHPNDDESSDLKIKYEKLEKQINEYKTRCSYRPDETNQQVEQPNIQKTKDFEKNFNAQIPVSENLYKIQIKTLNNTKILTNRMMEKQKNGGGIIINSVENFQIVPKILEDNPSDRNNNNNNNDNNVLQEPPGMKSTTSSNKKTSESNNNNKLLAPMPEFVIITPSNKIKPSSTIGNSIVRNKLKAIPLGVVPIPNEIPINDNNNSENIINSNRYLNAIIQTGKDKDNKDDDDEHHNKDMNFQNANELENGAHEVNDNNDFNIIDDKNHQQQHHLIEDEKINVNNNINNAAEEDTNIYDNKQNDNNNMDIEIIKKRNNKHGGKVHDHGKHKFNKNDKLMKEIVADQGKVAEYPDDLREDLHMEEQVEEEDDDEYANPAARQQQEPAVRN